WRITRAAAVRPLCTEPCACAGRVAQAAMTPAVRSRRTAAVRDSCANIPPLGRPGTLPSVCGPAVRLTPRRFARCGTIVAARYTRGSVRTRAWARDEPHSPERHRDHVRRLRAHDA